MILPNKRDWYYYRCVGDIVCYKGTGQMSPGILVQNGTSQGRYNLVTGFFPTRDWYYYRCVGDIVWPKENGQIPPGTLVQINRVCFHFFSLQIKGTSRNERLWWQDASRREIGIINRRGGTELVRFCLGVSSRNWSDARNGLWFFLL